MQIREVIDRILAYHPDLEGYQGCDEFKCGDPEQECTGIVTAISPTIGVIRQAIRLKANLLVVHEPTFYTSMDEPGWFEDFSNSVYEEKSKLLADNGIVIWRDHDHMHAHQPDGIFEGVLRYTGWKPYAVAVMPEYGGFGHFYIDLPEPMTVRQVADHLMRSIGMNGCRYLGQTDDLVQKIAIVGHLYPAFNEHTPKRADGKPKEYSVQLISELEQGVDLILPGETIDWTVLSYLKDAVELGRCKAMISLGHFNWEALGMKYAKDWISELVPEVEVTYVPAGDMFGYFLNEEKPWTKRSEQLFAHYEFRSIHPDTEAEEAAEIEQICFPPNEACSRYHMIERANAAPDFFLVAIDKETGKMAGFLNGLATDEEKFRDEFFTEASLHNKKGKNVLLLGLDVLPEYRLQGLGRELVYEYCRREQALGREKLILTCLDAKIRMYEKFGFKDLGLSASVWGGEAWHEMEIGLIK